jgi:putative hydrolase of the HAD superfamily
MPTSNVTDSVRSKKAVVFDLYHTLTAAESSWGDGTSTWAMLGVSLEAWDDQLLRHSRERLVGYQTDPFVIVHQMARAIDPTIPEDRIRAATENRIIRRAAAMRNIPQENLAVLQRLKDQGKLLALLSNADVMEIGGWDESEAARLFDVSVISCRVGMVKPERGIYELCLRELGVTADEAVFVGDGGSDELLGAKDVGMTAVMVTGVIGQLWPARVTSRLRQADYVIEQLSELLD